MKSSLIPMENRMLRKLKILDFTTLLPGPFAAWRLSELGADIIKIAAPNKKDLVLDGGYKLENGVSSVDVWLNHAKTDVVYLNLKEEKSVDEVKRLIIEDGYDIIMESNRPGIMGKFGLSYEDIKKFKEDIIYVSVTGFGQFGPYSNKAGHDFNPLGISGLADYTGTVESGPTHTSYQTTDMIAAHNAIIGLLTAYVNRIGTGRGCHVDVGMLDGLIPLHTMAGTDFLSGGKEPVREGNWSTGASIYDYYETKDGKYMTVASLEQKFWQKFCTILGKNEWIASGALSENWKEKKSELKRIFKTRTQKEWIEILTKADICVDPVLTTKEALLEEENIRVRKLTKKVKYKGVETTIFNEPIKFLQED